MHQLAHILEVTFYVKLQIYFEKCSVIFREHCIKLVQNVLQSTLSSFNDHNNHDHHHPDQCPQCPAYNAQSTLSHYPSHHDHHHSDRFPQCPAFFSKAFFLGNSWQLSCLQGELVKPVL